MELKGRIADHILGFKKPKGEKQGKTPPKKSLLIKQYSNGEWLGPRNSQFLSKGHDFNASYYENLFRDNLIS